MRNYSVNASVYSPDKLLFAMIGIITGFVILEINEHLRKNYFYREKPKGILRKYYLLKIRVRFVYTYFVFEMCEFFVFLGIGKMEKQRWAIILKSGLIILKNLMIVEPKLALTISDTLQNCYNRIVLEKL